MSDAMDTPVSTTAPVQEPRTRGASPPRIAAVGDFHWSTESDRGWVAEIAAEAARAADVLVLLGDLTTHGAPAQLTGFGRAFADLGTPVLAVLGNHDCECDHDGGAKEILADYGIQVLDGEAVVVNGVGFAGTKGFGGGFGRHALETFGEAAVKAFVDASVQEEMKLAQALAGLDTEIKVALLHYSPVADTMGDEPEQIWPFLGSSRLLTPLETYQVSVVFHGHAHHGSPYAATASGIPVFNAALPVLRRSGLRFRIWEARPAAYDTA